MSGKPQGMLEPSAETGSQSSDAVQGAFLADLAQFLAGRMLVAISSLVSIPIFTRLVPPGEFGNYVIVSGAVVVASTVTVGWICSSVLRFYPLCLRAASLAAFYRTTLRGSGRSLAAGLVVVVAMAAVAWRTASVSASGLRALLAPGVALFALYAWSQVLLSMLRAQRATGWYTIFNAWQVGGGLLLAVLAVAYLGLGVQGLLWGPVAANAIMLVPIWRMVVRDRPPANPGRDVSLLSDFARYGLPAAAIGLLSWVSSMSDRYVLGLLRGSAEVGIYSAGYGIAEQGMFALASLFSVTAVPIGFHMWETRGQDATRAFMASVARYFLLIGLPLCAALSVLARPLMQVLAAPEYLPGHRVIPIVSLGALLVGVANVFSEGLTFHRRTDLLLVCYLVPGLANVVLNLLSVGRYGYMAAAVNTLIAYAMLLALTALVSRRMFSWRFPLGSLARIAAATAIMALLVSVVAHAAPAPAVGLGLAAPAGAAAYLAALAVTGEVSKNGWQRCRHALGRVSGRFMGRQ